MDSFDNNIVKTSNVTSGIRGEKVAREFLEKLGYRFVQANYKNRVGEIDLIFIHGEFIVFVEVKTRLTDKYGYPEEAVNFAKQKQIRKTASLFMLDKRFKNYQPRFDVVGIFNNTINHTIDAFY